MLGLGITCNSPNAVDVPGLHVAERELAHVTVRYQ